MAFPRARRLPLLLCAVGVAALAGEGRARADKNDLQLLNLCPTPVQRRRAEDECGWIDRDGNGSVTGITFDADGAVAIPQHDVRAGLRDRAAADDARRHARLRRASSSRPSSASPRSTRTKMVDGGAYWDGIAAVRPNAPTAARARLRTSRPSAASSARGCGFRCPRSSSAPARSAFWARACTSCRATRRWRCRKAFTAGGCRRSPCADRRRSCSAPPRST